MQFIWVFYLFAAIAIVAIALATWRQLDHRADDAAWQSLSLRSDAAPIFNHSMVADLPESARRYFRYTIRPGTHLCTAVDIRMTGEIGLGTKADPDYRPMSAHQRLSPPHGLVWKLKAGAISGSDAALTETSWTRFWLFGLIPIVRASNPDHRRSAFGRVIAEAAIWAPASLLSSEFVTWEGLDQNTARATVRYGGFTQAVDIHIDDTGMPREVSILRWSNENEDKVFREQPFGGQLSEFRDFDGFQLPTHVEGGNHIGTPAYFPFFKADVTEITCARTR